jgi:hypothetical protein
MGTRDLLLQLVEQQELEATEHSHAAPNAWHCNVRNTRNGMDKSPEYFRAVADLISAVAWPAIVLYVLVAFRTRIAGLLDNAESLMLPGGFEAKFRRTLDREAEAIIQDKKAGQDSMPSRQLVAAQRVEQLAEPKGRDFARQQMLSLAREYELVRASMSPGDKRTREMEKLTTKMRTLGLAASASLIEFMDSDSPGARLAAVAILQVQPNPNTLDWLAERFKVEQPFVAYHAAVAMLVAARVLGPKHGQDLRNAIVKAQSYLGSGRESSDRYRVLQDALREAESNAR